MGSVNQTSDEARQPAVLIVAGHACAISSARIARSAIRGCRRFELIEIRSGERGPDTRIFRLSVGGVCKLMILCRSMILHCEGRYRIEGRNPAYPIVFIDDGREGIEPPTRGF